MRSPLRLRDLDHENIFQLFKVVSQICFIRINKCYILGTHDFNLQPVPITTGAILFLLLLLQFSSVSSIIID